MRNQARKNNHLLGRFGLVIGLMSSFVLGLLPAAQNPFNFVFILLAALAGYTIYIVYGN